MIVEDNIKKTAKHLSSVSRSIDTSIVYRCGFAVHFSSWPQRLWVVSRQVCRFTRASQPATCRWRWSAVSTRVWSPTLRGWPQRRFV